MRTVYLCQLAAGDFIIMPRASGQGPTWGMDGYVVKVDKHSVLGYTRITLDTGKVFSGVDYEAWCVMVTDPTTTTKDPDNGLPSWVRDLLP